MEIVDVLKETKNPLFKRREVELEAISSSTPNLSEVLKSLSEKFSLLEEAIKVKKIKGRFGSKHFIISANLYNSKEEKNSIETKSKKETELEKKQSEAKPAEAEKPAEIKQEDNQE